MKAHYINTGFPCTVTESCMDLFGGLTYAHADVPLSETLLDQGNTYWSTMYTNPCKYGFPGSSIDSSYEFGHFEVIDYAHRLGEMREWDNPVVVNNFNSQQTQHNEHVHAS